MIHHWTGVVFIPGAKLEDVLGVLRIMTGIPRITHRT